MVLVFSIESAKEGKMINKIYLIVGDANAGKTSLVKAILRGKYNTRKPVQMPLANGGYEDVEIPLSEAEQERKEDPQDCINRLNILNAKFSQPFSVVIVLRLNHNRWPSSQYLKVIRGAGYKIRATVVLDKIHNLPRGTRFPNPVFLGRINAGKYQSSLRHVYNATKRHFGWR